ncbi:DUF5615 family PIN-like protein [Alkalilimnicola sp. S0819]|uniref:DUF5615 family PIN-like protein n=1 Tax=Alkalilimnicola sp. S0819 TaxID=2613922 RepID=UPI0012614E84|nr:DUF5615 family PIN-like protein [Alkalilimnicola sp. S0819]KAB7627860.1 hypothetical protein F3N43_02475 [Alkalilimnicola sp. S0819]MPQ15494.1 hypothetical protein [Alkalilimnicola sp. S0819]
MAHGALRLWPHGVLVLSGRGRVDTGSPRRLLCDEMHLRLCRWLRAAGYDTAQPEPGAMDRDIMHQAQAEGRVLITADRGFLQRSGADEQVFFLGHGSLDEQARRLRGELGIDWLRAPFSRCMLCNHPLEQADEADKRICPPCDKLYWEGSHVRRMRVSLRCWAGSAVKAPLDH